MRELIIADWCPRFMSSSVAATSVYGSDCAPGEVVHVLRELDDDIPQAVPRFLHPPPRETVSVPPTRPVIDVQGARSTVAAFTNRVRVCSRGLIKALSIVVLPVMPGRDYDGHLTTTIHRTGTTRTRNTPHPYNSTEYAQVNVSPLQRTSPARPHMERPSPPDPTRLTIISDPGHGSEDCGVMYDVNTPTHVLEMS